MLRAAIYTLVLPIWLITHAQRSHPDALLRSPAPIASPFELAVHDTRLALRFGPEATLAELQTQRPYVHGLGCPEDREPGGTYCVARMQRVRDFYLVCWLDAWDRRLFWHGRRGANLAGFRAAEAARAAAGVRRPRNRPQRAGHGGQAGARVQPVRVPERTAAAAAAIAAAEADQQAGLPEERPLTVRIRGTCPEQMSCVPFVASTGGFWVPGTRSPRPSVRCVPWDSLPPHSSPRAKRRDGDPDDDAEPEAKRARTGGSSNQQAEGQAAADMAADDDRSSWGKDLSLGPPISGWGV